MVARIRRPRAFWGVTKRFSAGVSTELSGRGNSVETSPEAQDLRTGDARQLHDARVARELCLVQTDKPPLSESLHHEHEAIGSSSIEQPRERDRKLQREIEVLLKKAGLRANTDPAGGAKAVPSTGAETAGTSYQIIQGNRPSSEGRKPAAAHRHTPKNHAYSRVNNGLRWLEPYQLAEGVIPWD